jgi:hypothetical protein
VLQKQALRGAESEAFYQVMSAASRLGLEEMVRLTQDDETGVVNLLKVPELYQGQLVAIDGVARRAVQVWIEDPEIVRRMNMDHYWEVEVQADDFDETPVVCCLRELPEGMPTGDGIAARVRVPGFFFKLWAYRVRKFPHEVKRDSQGRLPRRLAPLIIGTQPIWYPPQKPKTNPYTGLVGGGLFVLAVVGVWIAVWRVGRGDQQFRTDKLARKHELDPGESLEGLEIPPQQFAPPEHEA